SGFHVTGGVQNAGSRRINLGHTRHLHTYLARLGRQKHPRSESDKQNGNERNQHPLPATALSSFNITVYTQLPQEFAFIIHKYLSLTILCENLRASRVNINSHRLKHPYLAKPSFLD